MLQNDIGRGSHTSEKYVLEDEATPPTGPNLP